MRTHSLRSRTLRCTAALSLVTNTRCFSIQTKTAHQHHQEAQRVLEKWFPAFTGDDDDTATFSVYNPADPNQVLAKVPLKSRQDAVSIIDDSYAALPAWRDETTPAFRASLLTAWSNLIQQHQHDIATIMTLESGKPLAESMGEVLYGTSFLDYYAAEIKRPSGLVLPSAFSNNNGSPKGHAMTLTQAVGVCGLVTPWNFPLAMATRKIGPALAAGCTAILKPSELTPLTALLLQQLAEEAGIPKHVVQTITTDSQTTPAIGDELCSNPNVHKISFTGSTRVGKTLMETCSSTVKRISLELGGNAPFVVFDDANIDVAIEATMASKFRNAGQTCVCADRFLIQRNIHDEFVEKLVQKIHDSLVVGPGMGSMDDDEGALVVPSTMGPVITAAACDGIHAKVQQAIQEHGATCVMGGTKLDNELGPNFYAPTILTNTSSASDIWKTETFGPVVAIQSFDTEEEAIQLANDSPVGLAAYVCTTDLGRTMRVSKALETGLVGVNEGIISTCTAPFGGVKESGLGREGSVVGLSEYMETKYVFINY